MHDSDFHKVQIAKLMAPVSGVQALGRGYYVLETL